MANIYYVYQHKENGSVVYIGKGKYDRAWSCRRSNPEHALWLESQYPDLDVAIVEKGLSEKEALYLEKKMIQELQPRFNKFYTEKDSGRLVRQGNWLASEKSVFNNPDFQRELGKRGAASLKHPNNTLQSCAHCGATMNAGHIARYHNNNCKKRVESNELN